MTMDALAQLSPFYLLLLAAAVLLAVLLVWLVIRARRPRTGGVVAGGTAGVAPRFERLRRALAGLLEALRYLAQRREWRYQVPWLLLLGEPGSGKTSLAASAGSPRRESLSGDEQALALPGTRWWFFERGVLVDLDSAASPSGRELEQRAAWGAVVRGLFDHRPERPIDGVVLTLSARSLLAGSAADLQRLAEQNYAQLLELQRRFEFTVPVYVVVTQCDAVEGFDAFWGLQPAERRREMVGWSNPYSLDSAFLPAWTDEAFDGIGAALKRLQLEAACGAAAAQEADRFFLFPQRLRELGRPLGSVLEGVFRPSAYHANFFFRGLYFTGVVGGEGVLLPKARGDVAFTDALLDEKAFAEANLARVNRQGLWSRHQAIRRLQLGIVTGFVLLCTWLAFAAYDLNAKVGETTAALRLIHDPRFQAADDRCADKASIYALLEHLARIDLDFNYLPIPASWIDRRHAASESRYVADSAFEQVIFPGLRCRLEARARDLVAGEGPVVDSQLAPPEAAARASEALVTQVRALESFEQNLAIYQAIVGPDTPEQGTAAQFEALATWLYGAPPPAAVFHQSGAHSAALARVEDPTPVALPERMRARAAEAVLRQAEAVHRELARRVVQGADYLQALDAGRGPAPDQVRGLVAWMHWVQDEWLAADGADPCGRLETALHPLLASLRGRYGYAEEITLAADRFARERCSVAAVRQLENLNVPPHGVLFERGPRGLAAAPGFQAELAHLESLAATRFMQQTPRGPLVCQAPLRGWDTDRLVQTTAALREFEQWLAAQGDHREAGRPLAERVARHQIEALAAELLGAAQIPFGLGEEAAAGVSPVATLDEQLRQQSADFARAVDPLVLAIQLLRQRGFEASATRVSQCARDFASDSLHSIDALAAASRLYAPDLSGAGAVPERLLLAGLGTDAEIKDYLKRQVQRGQVLGGYAAPFVAFLANTEGVDDTRLGNRETAFYWSNTIGELNRFVQFKEPNGQVAHLDDLVLKQLAALTVGNCATQLAAYRPAAYGNDLFSAHRAALERQASARCLNDRESVVYTGYQSLAREFNQTLAGRFPFGPDPQREAPAAAVRKFLLAYAAQREALRGEIKALPGGRWREVEAFLDQLDAAAKFFAGNLAAGESSQPLQLRLGFRAFPERSPGSEQLVNWRFRSGSEAAVFPNGVRELQWQFGRPVALELVWAEQSRLLPASDAAQRHLRVDRTTASFTAEGPWSLLKLIHAHAARSLPHQDGLDAATRLLEFEVPVADKESGAGQPRSRMFLSLQLLGADPSGGKSPLRLPETFPTYAPLAW